VTAHPCEAVAVTALQCGAVAVTALQCEAVAVLAHRYGAVAVTAHQCGAVSVTAHQCEAVAVEVDSSERPTFPVFANADHFSNAASSDEVVREESVYSSTGVHTNYGPCNILSNPGLHYNRNLEYHYNNPSPGYNTESDTNDLPMNATTSHSRKTSLLLCQEQRKHRLYLEALPHPEVRQMESAEGGWPQQDHSPLKKDNARIPRIRYGYSCNKPAPRIHLILEG